MMEETHLEYHYDHLMDQTEWLFVTPGNNDSELSLRVQECGRFFFDGRSFTDRGTVKSYEIAYIMSDTDFRLHYNGNAYHFGKRGSLMFIDCTKGYRIESCGYGDVYFVHFWGERAAYDYALFEKYNKSLPYLDASDIPVAEELEKIIAIYRNPTDETADLYAQTCLIKLIQTILQLCFSPRKRDVTNEYLTNAVAYMKSHLSEQLTLANVASEVRISRSYLAMLFRREMGLTFSTWLKKARINKVKELLRTTDLSLEDICFETGIYDSSYLCRLFREFEHLTPDQYRKNWKITV